MSTDDRDLQFERALAGHLTNASPDCPDAEVIAAFHENSLSTEEMTRCERHVASCTRCQEALAILEQTDAIPVQDFHLQPVEELAVLTSAVPKPPVTPLSRVAPAAVPTRQSLQQRASKFRPRADWRWLAPVGAVAAAVIVWIGSHEIRLEHLQKNIPVQVAENRASESQPYATPAPPPPPAADTSQSDEIAKSKMSSAPPRSQKELPAPGRHRADEPKTAVPAAKGEITADRKDAPVLERQISPQPTSGALAKSLPQSPPVAVSGAASGLVAPQRAEKLRNEAAPAPSAANQVQSRASELDAMTSAAMPAKKLESHALLRDATDHPRYIVAPGEKHAWLVGDAGRIETTSDGGKTWTTQTSSVTADLMAGSATSNNVCWVVGRAGTILLTTDGGKNWRQLASPIATDIGGIHATDASHASIWDVPNRHSFQTTDGGVTWMPMANE